MLTTIGLMSGTSMDGIDIAAIRTDGKDVLVRNIQPIFYPYEKGFREKLRNSLEDAKLIVNRDDRPSNLHILEQDLTKLHAQAIDDFILKNNLDTAKIDLIGYSGQTVLHRPEIGLTVQLGDGQLLADLTGVNVIYDMRANDMAHGGQGAPLVPIYHQSIAKNATKNFDETSPMAIVNIGGISNITIIDPNLPLVAFDCGPGNALIDQWVLEKTNEWYDKDGQIGWSGQANEEVLQKYLSLEFFHKKPPKSLDRLDFTLDFLTDRLSLEDGARTLSKLTAKGMGLGKKLRYGYANFGIPKGIMKSCEFCQTPPKLWIICGGGRKNRAIMHELIVNAQEFGAKVVPSEEIDFNGDFIEAEAFAYLAVRSFKNLPLTFPTTTGCRSPISGGRLTKPKKNNRLFS